MAETLRRAGPGRTAKLAIAEAAAVIGAVVAARGAEAGSVTVPRLNGGLLAPLPGLRRAFPGYSARRNLARHQRGDYSAASTENSPC
jgi:hypothetical protein